MWLNTTHDSGVANRTLTNPGQDGYETILHEMGHALGLDHPFGGINNLPAEFENQLHTVMSYTKANIFIDGKQWYPSAPMLDDILAIQTMYGVNTQNHYLDDNYVFSNDADHPDIQALWDADGNDTFNASNQTKSVFINLNPGEFSSIGTGDPNKAYIAIAYQVEGQANNWIENAIGGSGADKLFGNDADNKLTGNGGNDTYLYTSGDGTDTILDHDGSDQIKINGVAVSGEFKPGFDGSHIYFSADKAYELQELAGGTWRLAAQDPSSKEHKAVADLKGW